jgi:hypothetical protein
MSSDIQQLQQRIDRMERCAAKIALLEEAIRIADSLNDVASGFSLRQQLVAEAQFSGYPEKALVAFSWNLAQADRDPEQFDESDLLWQYKWIVGDLHWFPQISIRQIEEALTNLTLRSERNGASPRHVHSLRCQAACSLGDREMVTRTLPLWKKSPRDFLSDCMACERDSLVDAHIFLGQDRRAVQVAGPILNRTMRCGEIPHLTYARILLPLVRLNRLEEAKAYHRQGYAMVKNGEGFLVAIADHLIFMVLTRDLKGATKLFESHLLFALRTHALLRRYFFYRATIFLFRQMLKSSKSNRKFRLPNSFPLWNEKGTYDLLQVKEWFESEALALARQFDARNNNTYRSDELDNMADLDDLVQPVEDDPQDS